MERTVEFEALEPQRLAAWHDRLVQHRFPDGLVDPARAVLCIPGYAASGESFARLRPLASEFDLRLLTITARRDHANPIRAHAAYVAQFARSFKRPVLVGASFGGLVAIEAASMLRDAIAGVVLMSTCATVESLTHRLLVRSGMFSVLETLGTMLRPGLAFLAGAPSETAVAQELHREALALGRDETHARLWAALEADLRRTAQSVRVPVLIIHGEEDRVVPVSAAYDLTLHIPHADLAVLDKAGHLPHLTHAPAVNGLLQRFLRQRFTRSSPWHTHS